MVYNTDTNKKKGQRHMNKDKIFSFIFTATATGVFTFGAWLLLVAFDRIFLLLGI